MFGRVPSHFSCSCTASAPAAASGMVPACAGNPEAPLPTAASAAAGPSAVSASTASHAALCTSQDSCSASLLPQLAGGCAGTLFGRRTPATVRLLGAEPSVNHEGSLGTS